jgi:hypothetical protein
MEHVIGHFLAHYSSETVVRSERTLLFIYLFIYLFLYLRLLLFGRLLRQALCYRSGQGWELVRKHIFHVMMLLGIAIISSNRSRTSKTSDSSPVGVGVVVGRSSAILIRGTSFIAILLELCHYDGCGWSQMIIMLRILKYF